MLVSVHIKVDVVGEFPEGVNDKRVGQERKTPEFQSRYALRSGIEGTIAQKVHAFGLGCSRYMGLAKTHLHMIATAAAIDLHCLAVPRFSMVDPCMNSPTASTFACTRNGFQSVKRAKHCYNLTTPCVSQVSCKMGAINFNRYHQNISFY